jgi:hypothetical protein
MPRPPYENIRIPPEPHWLEVLPTPRLGPREYGLFTRVHIPEDELIGFVPGRIIVDPGYVSNTCVCYGEQVMIEPFPPMTFMNHCCKPNAYFSTVERDGLAMLGLFADRNLKPGKEILVDYMWERDIECLCGHKKCRGTI